MADEMIEVEGVGVVPNLPDKVECPQCEELYGDLEV